MAAARPIQVGDIVIVIIGNNKDYPYYNEITQIKDENITIHPGVCNIETIIPYGGRWTLGGAMYNDTITFRPKPEVG